MTKTTIEIIKKCKQYKLKNIILAATNMLQDLDEILHPRLVKPMSIPLLTAQGIKNKSSIATKEVGLSDSENLNILSVSIIYSVSLLDKSNNWFVNKRLPISILISLIDTILVIVCNCNCFLIDKLYQTPSPEFQAIPYQVLPLPEKRLILISYYIFDNE